MDLKEKQMISCLSNDFENWLIPNQVLKKGACYVDGKEFGVELQIKAHKSLKICIVSSFLDFCNINISVSTW